MNDHERKRENRLKNEGDTTGDANSPSKEEAEKAKALAQKQRDLRDNTAKAAEQAQPDPKATEKQAKQQNEADKLSKDLDAAAHAPTNKEGSATSLSQAADAAKKAGEQMDKSSPRCEIHASSGQGQDRGRSPLDRGTRG